MAIAKQELTGKSTYSDLRIFQSCKGIILRCDDANIPDNVRIDVMLNDGKGGKRIIPNLLIHDLAEINAQRFPVGFYTLNELKVRLCDYGALNLGDEQHLVISISGLDAAKKYELIADAKGNGNLSNKPIIYSNNTIPVGNNKAIITPKPGAIFALPDSGKIIEVAYTYKSGVTERLDAVMLKTDQMEDNGLIAVDTFTKADPTTPILYHGFMYWFTDSLAQYSKIEIELDETGFNYILVEGLAIS
ncbi:hypothetical protein [Sunxiuqinia elliptica]|uniref:Viral coat protein P2 N-terminal domain-containing protein n=1 Tax=Sunxiuqinia elliptica TaxID=655355 RepID=A0A4V3BXS2_9BACT|nr:hypothetical protein [Sunxiuqinia elliptica]TDN99948.1 hypothetical protein DET52_106161 [Sunxiuqinia elliptica]TDO57140.1 hypothetical protein DET65_3725 [Sunxiuqinia elliptica]